MTDASGADFVLAGELFDGAPGAVSSTWRAGGFTSMFDFPMYYALRDVFCGEAPAGRLASVLWADRLYDDPEGLITFIDNHDLPRAVSACDGDLDAVTAMLRFIFAVRGTPAVTWGTEAGLAGAGEPENRASMPWGAQAPLANVLRDSGRLRPALPGGRIVQLSEEGFDYLRADGSLLRVEGGRVAVLPAADGVEADSTGGTLRVAASGSPAGAGDTLVLVGAGPELGSWDASAGLPLPIEGFVLPAGAVLDFKLVVLRSDGAVVWEDRGNRYLLIEAGMSKEIELEWGV
jgi:hypothetical protein